MTGEAIPRAESAQKLTSDLMEAYDALKRAVGHFGSVQEHAGEFLDAHNAIPVGPEGLDDGLHELYQAWNQTPSADEFETLIR